VCVCVVGGVCGGGGRHKRPGATRARAPPPPPPCLPHPAYQSSGGLSPLDSLPPFTHVLGCHLFYSIRPSYLSYNPATPPPPSRRTRPPRAPLPNHLRPHPPRSAAKCSAVQPSPSRPSTATPRPSAARRPSRSPAPASSCSSVGPPCVRAGMRAWVCGGVRLGFVGGQAASLNSRFRASYIILYYIIFYSMCG
jgi:hypothetical protein